MGKLNFDKYRYTPPPPPPVDPLEAPRNKTVAFIDEMIKAKKSKADFPRGFKDKGDYYEVKIRSSNKVVFSMDVVKTELEHFLTDVRHQVASKNADDWFTGEGAVVAKTASKRREKTPEEKAALSAKMKAAWEKRKAAAKSK